MSYSLLIHSDIVQPADQAALLRALIRSAPRGTVVVRTNDGESVTMRYPLVGGRLVEGGYQVFLTYLNNIVYTDDIAFVEAYDPNPNFNPEGT